MSHSIVFLLCWWNAVTPKLSLYCCCISSAAKVPLGWSMPGVLYRIVGDGSVWLMKSVNTNKSYLCMSDCKGLESVHLPTTAQTLKGRLEYQKNPCGNSLNTQLCTSEAHTINPLDSRLGILIRLNQKHEMTGWSDFDHNLVRYVPRCCLCMYVIRCAHMWYDDVLGDIQSTSGQSDSMVSCNRSHSSHF